MLYRRKYLFAFANRIICWHEKMCCKWKLELTEELTTATTTHLIERKINGIYPKVRIGIKTVNFCSFHNTTFIFVRYILYQTRKLAPVFQSRRLQSWLKVGCQRVKKSVSRLFCINYLYFSLRITAQRFWKDFDKSKFLLRKFKKFTSSKGSKGELRRNAKLVINPHSHWPNRHMSICILKLS